MYKILHIPTGEFVYADGTLRTTFLSFIISTTNITSEISRWNPIFKSHKDATDAIRKIIIAKEISFWKMNDSYIIINNPLKAEFEVIES